ncbi:hypothetical protein PAXINDRAFT_90534 [Paxillus involutus ATCC 200175]|uniref:Uncharacterized protein n=1 Tax=Paxillus involutus ATCC 200175 TaxID=664439 RepID=A0A0C9TH78_PAXIN|nr:hypothetical protein PAXINDRAFT_90534 [Paxillus involutus ATCC 200175]
MSRLPPAFTSLYRLVLRSTSASVLHHTIARKNLCKLWRPAFDAAAQVVRELQSHQLSQMERTRRERLLSILQLRVDATLTLLLNSANSRGIPHQVVRNLNLLRKRHVDWVQGGYYSQLSKNAWKPQLSPTAPEYSPRSLIPESHRAAVIQARRRENKQVDERCWNALGEVVRMAEGRHNMSLGRVRLKPWAMEKS